MKKNGFTLLELLIGVSLISIVMVFLFRLLHDIQQEALSNTYIVANQTNRNEMVRILDEILFENGDVCNLFIGASNTNKLYKIGFCNNSNDISITVSKKSILLEYDSKKYNYPMKDSAGYYDINMLYNVVSFNGKKYVKFLIKTHKKGLRATLIDDIEFMGTVSVLKIKKENIDEYGYTGEEETFTAPKSGTYKLEVWGAQGGNAEDYKGGFGGYSSGTMTLNSGDKLYINVGGQGESSCANKLCTGGYNGGGSSGYVDASVINGAGGGATSIATSSGLLSSLSEDRTSIIMVAGGGGGATSHNNNSTFGYKHNGGAGGGIEGNGACAPTDKADDLSGSGCGGNQESTGDVSTSYGTQGSFGQGADLTCSGAAWSSNYALRKCYAPGGGGGYYGGSTGNHGVAGGGSGYINTTSLSDASMYCYSCTNSDEPETKTVSILCAYDEPTPKCAKEGNGYVKITYLGS